MPGSTMPPVVGTSIRSPIRSCRNAYPFPRESPACSFRRHRVAPYLSGEITRRSVKAAYARLRSEAMSGRRVAPHPEDRPEPMLRVRAVLVVEVPVERGGAGEVPSTTRAMRSTGDRHTASSPVSGVSGGASRPVTNVRCTRRWPVTAARSPTTTAGARRPPRLPWTRTRQHFENAAAPSRGECPDGQGVADCAGSVGMCAGS